MTYVVSVIHGCFDKFKKLLKEGNSFRNLKIRLHLLIHNQLNKGGSVLNSRGRDSGSNIITKTKMKTKIALHKVTKDTVATTLNTSFLNSFHEIS